MYGLTVETQTGAIVYLFKINQLNICFFFKFAGRLGTTADKGVPDMTSISDIDEVGINNNLKNRYQRDQIYVSFCKYKKTIKKIQQEIIRCHFCFQK